MIRHDQCTFIFSPLPQSEFSTESNLMWIKAHDQNTFDKKEYSKYFGKSQNYKSPRVLELDIKDLKTILGKKRLIKLYLIFLYHMIRSVSQYRGIPLHLNFFFFHFDIEMSIFTEYQFTNPSFRIRFIKVSNAFKYR